MRSGLLSMMLFYSALGCSNAPKEPIGKENLPKDAQVTVWQEITSTERKFKFKMPATPEKKQMQAPDGGSVIVWTVKAGIDKVWGTFTVTAGPSPIPNEMVTKAGFDVARDTFLTRFKAKLVSESDFMRQEKLIGRHVEVEIPEIRLKGRTTFITLNGSNYQLSMTGDSTWDGWKKADHFFESFDLLP